MSDTDSASDLPAMDQRKIPARLLVDTGVLIRALEFDQHKDDPRTVDCRDFWVAALKNSTRRVLVAAPSVTELLLKPPGSAVPSVRSVVVVPFDHVSATTLATGFPSALVESLKNDFSVTAIRYDAMIAACAARHRALAVVSLDVRLMKAACKALGVAFFAPSHFRSSAIPVSKKAAQPSLFEMRGAAPSAPPAPPPSTVSVAKGYGAAGEAPAPPSLAPPRNAPSGGVGQGENTARDVVPTGPERSQAAPVARVDPEEKASAGKGDVG